MNGKQVTARKAAIMGISASGIDGLRAALERKETELAVVLRRRDGIEIQKSADQMDEIQDATERDLAISAVDRDSSQLRQVKAALLRIREGAFGSCVECESAIGPKRLAAVPWAARCIRCQEALAEPLSHAA
jgi:DnaK suppressor protein